MLNISSAEARIEDKVARAVASSSVFNWGSYDSFVWFFESVVEAALKNGDVLFVRQ